MGINELLELYKDENGYIDPAIIHALTYRLASKEIVPDDLTKLYRSIVIRNTSIIEKQKVILSQSDSILIVKKQNEIVKPNITNSQVITTNDTDDNEEIDKLFNVVTSETDLVDFLLTRISSKSIADKLLLRLLKEKNEFIKLSNDSDGHDKKICYEESTRLQGIINSIKAFYDVSDEEIKQFESLDRPINQLIYLSNGSRCLPLEDIKSIPKESHSTIRRLLVGMSYNRFKRAKRLNGVPLSQVSDSNTVRVFFDKVGENKFLVAGVYIKKSYRYGEAEWDYVISRSNLCKNYDVLGQSEDKIEATHQKVLTLLDTSSKGGHK